jgi:hypothetical protein
MAYAERHAPTSPAHWSNRSSRYTNTRKKSMLEKQVEKYLVKKVKEAGGLTYKWISTVSGVPDRIVFLNEKCYLVELKTETGVLSPRQILVFDELGEAGFSVHILRNQEDIAGFIREATAP